MFTKRLGLTSPEQPYCAHGCPDIIEMEGGDYAVIGTDITTDATGKLPTGSGVGPGERIIRIPRELLVKARRDIPVA